MSQHIIITKDIYWYLPLQHSGKKISKQIIGEVEKQRGSACWGWLSRQHGPFSQVCHILNFLMHYTRIFRDVNVYIFPQLLPGLRGKKQSLSSLSVLLESQH